MGGSRSIFGSSTQTMKVQFPTDEDGYTGRECPECERFFQLVFGTGIQESIPCYCPYCGHRAAQQDFLTPNQLRLVRSHVARYAVDEIHNALKGLEFDIKPPRGGFGIGLSLKVKRPRRIPLHRYQEPALETPVECSQCTLKYKVYGLYGHCPDCGRHNALQIFETDLDLVLRMLEAARTQPQEFQKKQVESALKDCVASFDAFGRELCSRHAARAVKPAKAEKISFQNLAGAQTNLQQQFSMDLAAGLSSAEWDEAVKAFQKRHVFAHKRGVVDQGYVDKSGDATVTVGHLMPLEEGEVVELVRILRLLANHLSASF